MTHFSEAERPIGLQLFGSEPDLLAAAAQKAEGLDVDLIDLNFGCPAPRIVRSGEGGALLRDPALCSEIFKTVVQAVHCPVTVKLRLGWDDNQFIAAEIARRAEDAGIGAVTVHGRTVAQGFRGKADWDAIGQVKEAVQIPVFGNGDIATAEDALSMLERCGCAGIAIGRAALGNPWIFEQIRDRMRGKKAKPAPSLQQRLAVYRRHLELSVSCGNEKGALREMRRQAARYMRGFPGAASARRKLTEADSVSELGAAIEEMMSCETID